MANYSPGKIWNPIWSEGTWAVDVWAPEGDAENVSPGRVWKEVWLPGVWNVGVWATDDPTIQILYPDSTVFNNGWTLVGGISADVILAAINDTSYIRTSVLLSAVNVTLDDPDPSYQTVSTATLKIRARKTP